MSQEIYLPQSCHLGTMAAAETNWPWTDRLVATTTSSQNYLIRLNGIRQTGRGNTSRKFLEGVSWPLWAQSSM